MEKLRERAGECQLSMLIINGRSLVSNFATAKLYLARERSATAPSATESPHYPLAQLK
jgi:hypothetical protein